MGKTSTLVGPSPYGAYYGNIAWIARDGVRERWLVGAAGAIRELHSITASGVRLVERNTRVMDPPEGMELYRRSGTSKSITVPPHVTDHSLLGDLRQALKHHAMKFHRTRLVREWGDTGQRPQLIQPLPAWAASMASEIEIYRWWQQDLVLAAITRAADEHIARDAMTRETDRLNNSHLSLAYRMIVSEFGVKDIDVSIAGYGNPSPVYFG